MHIITFLLSLNLIATQPAQQKHETSPKETVVDFLKWYRTNYNAIMDIPLVKGGVYDKQDSTSFYSVDFSGVNRYLEALRKSAYVSETYLASQHNYFLESNEQLLLSKQNDGPPEGFDYDLIMRSQEFDLDMIEQAKVSEEINGDKAKVWIEFPYEYVLEYSLTKSGSHWLIDEITIAT